MSRFLQVFYVFFSGMVQSFSIPNELLDFGSPFAGLISLIPLYLALSNARSYKESFFLTGLQALVVHLCSSFWLANFRDFAIFTLGASALGTACIAAVTGWLLHVPYAGNGRAAAAPAYRAVYFAAVWTIWEWAKSTGFLGYPWGTLSMSAYRLTPIIQIADITGVYGITFLFAVFAASCGELLLFCGAPASPHGAPNPVKTVFPFTAVLFLLAAAYGAFRLSNKPEPRTYLNITLVQQNKDPWESEDDDDAIELSEQLTEQELAKLRSAGTDTDLVVWSEVVLRYPYPQASTHYDFHPESEPLTEFIRRMNVPFIIGAPYTLRRAVKPQKGSSKGTPAEYGNAAILFDREGAYSDSYCKIHLVPFAEVIPGVEYEWARNLMDTLVGFSNGWKAGPAYKTFTVTNKTGNAVRISTPICFEDAFPAVTRQLYKEGSEIFVNLTDDSWSRTKSAEYQHCVIAAMRAVELRCSMVRSTNSGYSVHISSDGTIRNGMPLFTQSAGTFRVPVYSRKNTVYALAGNCFVYLCMLYAVITILYCTAAERHRQKNS